MRILFRGILTGLLLCAMAQPLTAATACAPGFTQTGDASWYGGVFHGRRTASGERFDKHALTAAHKTLPMGSLVRVENLRNGYSVEVRINDRGPYCDGRIIDLSREAADVLGIIRAGEAPVRITVLDATARDAEPPTIRFM